MLNSAKGLISQRRRVEKKNDISFSFYIEKKTFTANFAQSAENNADPVFIKSGIYIYMYIYIYIYIYSFIVFGCFAY